jgi:hypothetical protein
MCRVIHVQDHLLGGMIYLKSIISVSPTPAPSWEECALRMTEFSD